MRAYMWCIWLPLLYLVYSVPLFVRVYDTSQAVIDEEFHLRQGLHFCNKRLDIWDPKITTFPGLYLFSLILNPFNFCTVLGLRLISLFAGATNVVLLYKIRLQNLGSSKSSVAALDATTMVALPPLYFFNHLYYTDTLSLTSVLLFYLYWQKQSHLQAAVFAAASVLVRQTNVVWVGMFFGITSLDTLAANYAAAYGLKPHQVELFNIKTWWNILRKFSLLVRSIWQTLCCCGYYLAIMLPFIAFISINGSIVLGDKQSHQVHLHLPQLFYFAMFCLIFAVTNTFSKLYSALRRLASDKLILIFLIGVCILIVKWNTLVHPYLLADNRHYTFYVWQRFYAHYSWFRYAMCPVYLLALTLIHIGLQHMRDSFKLMFWLAVSAVLCFQRLLEVRYFLTPFILFRLNIRPSSRSRIFEWLELGFYLLLNAITFYIFFTKEIEWPNLKEPQRLIW